MIEILSYKPTNLGKKIGFVEIYVPKFGMIFRHLAHLQSGNKRWINFPTFSEEEGAKKHFNPYFSFKTEIHNSDFLEQVNEAVKKYCELNHISPPNPLDLSGNLDECPF